jgi:hypothetical protein
MPIWQPEWCGRVVVVPRWLPHRKLRWKRKMVYEDLRKGFKKILSPINK